LKPANHYATSANAENQDAVQGANDAVWLFQTRSEQRRNAPDFPVSSGLPPDGATAALSALQRELAIGGALRLAFIPIGRATHLAE
jgi:hypothetical protein